ncbi:MAG TPA: hypothetical protein VM941_03305 [Pyrinomonadaceae bacterium]|jgi:uncharacterized membrane protein YagU involved in acid resistance|nr:hypothetical protein [Pyrinomonadaceae bacterium]
MTKSSASKTIFWGGLIAGALDLTGACVVSWLRAGFGPVRVMQSISSGVIGVAAYSGGAKTAALGVVLHFLIATIWTVVFYAASRKLRFLVEQPVLWGLVYGVFVYAFMNFVVLPLSALPPSRFAPTLTGRLIQLLLIMFCIGLPIAIIVRHFSKQP